MPTVGAKTDFLENKLLDHVLRNVAYTAPATVYVALFTAAPGEAGGGTEVTGGSYARKAATFAVAAGGLTSNTADINFGTASADWGNIGWIAIFDALTVGNMLYYGALTAPKLVSNGDTVKILIGQLVVSED